MADDDAAEARDQPPQGARGHRGLHQDGQDRRRRRGRPRAPPPLPARRCSARSHLYAHDEANDVREGDRVRIAETRPLSKLKRWRVVEVLERAR